MKRSTSLAESIDGQRFWDDMLKQAEIGALIPRGLGRLALDDNDNNARCWLVEQGRALGCEAFYDAMGNVFLRREGRDPNLPPLLIGSHLDSQPNAGIYDGTLGVLAGLAVLRALQESDFPHQQPVEVVSWTNEEGARFAPGASGSSWFAGQRETARILGTVDDDGVRFADALSTCQTLLDADKVSYRPYPFTPSAFLELHIEQGPVLESLGVPVCTVKGIQGVNWYSITVNGQANHAGTTPEHARRDAFTGAHGLITALREAVAEHGESVRFTIGKFTLEPNATNTIPQQATFSIDLRHPSTAVLTSLDNAFQRLATETWSGCSVELTVSSRVSPVEFDKKLVETLDASVKKYAPDAPKLVSGAFHDAIHLAHQCPTAMLFMPCRSGISHHPDEYIEREDAEIAVRALADAVGTLLTR
ncbi:M20 family metallo-hydrolase [Vreelandella janggokensis]|uniref:M20 family metallo-hydrolase n=1 Tax=Vreelandella janggokensis TaxID=370767 RepID=UPI0028622918|nr:M20 family metallo-hydrolase [Halomonas janggokensis]MDR5886728.1 M20 family metallo-hydrolase [Halomonas janggokensis]